MLENSTLDNDKIVKLLKDNYGIKVSHVEKINRGSANIFNIDGKYILKEFPSGRQISDIKKEYDVISFLNSRGLRVPKYINTLNNSFYVLYNDRIVILQVFLDGYSMENNTGDYNKTIESASILGKLSKCLEDYPQDGDYDEFPTREKISEGINKLKDLSDKINDDNPYKDIIKKQIDKRIEIAKRYLNFDFDKIKNVTVKTCHGDYSVQQLIYNDNKDTAIIDFETVRNMPISWEIIRSYSYIDKEVKNGEFNLDTFSDYVREVKKYITLTKDDLEYMPYIYLFQLVISTFGYKQYNNDYKKKSLLDFAFFRTNMCIYLDKNMNLIVKRLEELL